MEDARQSGSSLNRNQRLPPEVCKKLVEGVMTRRQIDEFRAGELECKFRDLRAPGGAGPLSRQTSFPQPAASCDGDCRTDYPTIISGYRRSRGCRRSYKDIVETKRGLVLVVGATGSGKSTSLAAMIDHPQQHSPATSSRSRIRSSTSNVAKLLVTHRESAIDTHPGTSALKNTLRQAPDVILIGEIRDAETMEHAIAVLRDRPPVPGTLHANSASQTIDRIVNFFPEERRKQLLMDLSRTCARSSRSGWCARWTARAGRRAIEILINTPTIAERIFNGEFTSSRRSWRSRASSGMRTFDWALFELYNEAIIPTRSAAQCRFGERVAPQHQAEEHARRAEGQVRAFTR
jgi:twitching motility protein PilU